VAHIQDELFPIFLKLTNKILPGDLNDDFINPYVLKGLKTRQCYVLGKNYDVPHLPEDARLGRRRARARVPKLAGIAAQCPCHTLLDRTTNEHMAALRNAGTFRVLSAA
jgi:hypothetical protein